MIYILISIYDFIFCIMFATSFNCLKICFAIYLVFFLRGGGCYTDDIEVLKTHKNLHVSNMMRAPLQGDVWKRPGLQCISENSF